MKSVIAITISMAAILVAIPFFKAQAGGGNVQLTIEHFVGKDLLKLDSVLYNNELNQTYAVTKFKYYIGKIKFKKANGGFVALNDYYLVDEEEPLSKQILLKDIDVGEYTGMEFIIGVDSIDNCSGAQEGALDPVNAMFWTWNTGYIFMKLEGVSKASKSPAHVLEYHIGGYKPPANCIRTVTLLFDKHLIVRQGKVPQIKLKTDVEEVFENPATIDFSKLSSVTDFHNATIIATNYGNMFSFVSIIQ